MRVITKRLLSLVSCLLLAAHWSVAQAVAVPRPVETLGNLATLDGWTGVVPSSDAALLNLPGEATFRYAPRADGSAAPSAGDWLDLYGLRFDVRLDDDRPVTIDVTLRTGPNDNGVAAKVVVAGKGWHAVSLPWDRFDFPQSASLFLDNIQSVTIGAKADDGQPGTIALRDAKVVRAEVVALTAPQRGRSVEAGGTAEYLVTVGNCTDRPQGVTLSFERTGFEAMAATVEPNTVQLPPGAAAQVAVRVQVPRRVPPGGHETQTLQATGNGSAPGSSKIAFVTASKLDHPNILHTKAGWDAIRENVKRYDWAKEAANDNRARADKWVVPDVMRAPPGTTKDQMRGRPLFRTQVEHDLMAAGISYQLTQDVKYAEKVRRFLLNLSNPEDGYPLTRRACDQASVQEGHFFQHIAMAYDMTIPSGVFTPADRRQIDDTLRLSIGTSYGPGFGGNISNWNVSSLCGALYSSLVLQDLDAANRFLYGKGALIDQLAQGTLDDGWWYEVSISYNVWCATEFSQVALAMRPWGVDLANRSFPSSYRPNVKAPDEGLYGMSKQRWGPIYNNGITIKRLWDALPGMPDYRGVMFGLNDSTERMVGGPSLDIAYYLYRDPAYVPLIKSGGKRDLLYAVPELPEGGVDRSRTSLYSDNAGVAVLRSQTDGRPQREQIQAVLHYGDHGWFHGHFDRTNLLHLSRYGRSFYNPEMVWYGYPNYMYKFYVQTSVSKNMVVVDQKQQEPVESQRTLFHTGKMMQASVVQTNARWSNPPYGGMRYHDQPHETFAAKAFAEGRSVPIPENAPKYGEVTDYSEPILQRRLMVVTDDYVVLADYLKGEQEHTFESLLQMKGFKGLDAAGKQSSRHAGQWSTDPLGSAQFVTDADWYEASAPVRGSYEFRWGPGSDNAGTRTEQNEPGVLKIDAHHLWPPQQQIMVATVPESHPVEKRLFWAISGDDKKLAEGQFGAWILGKEEIDLPVEGIKALKLRTRVEASKKSTVFWGNARVVTAGGKEIPLAQLPLTYDNVEQPGEAGKDYYGGPIKIVGERFDVATLGQPKDAKREGIATVDLSGIDAVRFKATLGGDFPLGDEAHRRKTVASKVVGKEARFLTLLEPFESDSVIEKAVAESADRLRVELTDGRVQIIEIGNFTDEPGRATVTIHESKDGQPTRSESTSGESN